MGHWILIYNGKLILSKVISIFLRLDCWLVLTVSKLFNKYFSLQKGLFRFLSFIYNQSFYSDRSLLIGS